MSYENTLIVPYFCDCVNIIFTYYPLELCKNCHVIELFDYVEVFVLSDSH